MPDQGGGELNSRLEVPCQLIVARRDGAEMFELAEEIFDEVSGFVKLPIVISGCSTLALGRNDGLDSGLFQRLNDPVVSVVGFVGSEGPTVRNRTVRNRIFGQISPSACARRWIGHQKLNSAATLREIMAGMSDFPCFGLARAHLSRIKRAPIAGGHNAGNTDASGGAAVARRV